jgi:class 3 adenylate cyclase
MLADNDSPALQKNDDEWAVLLDESRHRVWGFADAALEERYLAFVHKSVGVIFAWCIATVIGGAAFSVLIGDRGSWSMYQRISQVVAIGISAPAIYVNMARTRDLIKRARIHDRLSLFVGFCAVVPTFHVVVEQAIECTRLELADHPGRTVSETKEACANIVGVEMFHAFVIAVACNLRCKTVWPILLAAVVSPFVSLAYTSEHYNYLESDRDIAARGVVYALVVSMTAAAAYVVEQQMRESFLLQKATLRLTAETKVTAGQINALLVAMLPKSVLSRLVDGDDRIFDIAQKASVSFSDIAGFTNWSATRTSQQVVQLVSTIITAFDSAARQCDVTKVKTIGDAYWAICGLPEETEHSALRICNFALGQQELLAEMNELNPEWGTIELRVGCHTGPIVGGVIGRRQLSYEVFGLTNEIAEQCEQQAPLNGVLVTVDTKLMADDGDIFEFELCSIVIDRGATYVVSRRVEPQVVADSVFRRRRRGKFRGSRKSTRVLEGGRGRARVMGFFGIVAQPVDHSTDPNPLMLHDVEEQSLVSVQSFADDSEDFWSDGGSAAVDRNADDPVDPDDVPHAAEVDADTANTEESENVDGIATDRLARVGSCCNQKFAVPAVEVEFYEFDCTNKKGRQQITALRVGVVGFASLFACAIVVPADEFPNVAAGMAAYGAAGVLGVALFVATFMSEVDRLRARIVYGAAMSLTVLLIVGSALTVGTHTMISHTMVLNFMVGLLISPPADMPLPVHVAYSAACLAFNLVMHSYAVRTGVVVGLLFLVFVVVWYGYIQDRLDRDQFATKVSATAAAVDTQREINLQRQMLARMAPAHVQEDMVALVASEEYRRGEPANLTHDLSDVTVCFCKIRISDEHRNAAKAYDDIMGMHERVEQLLAKFPHAVKIKTVGQTVIVAGPLHVGASKRECTRAAREIFRFSHEVVRCDLASSAGVSTGDITAAVIGADGIAYDTFGDTVNTAARCMTTAEEGMVQAALSTTIMCGEVHGIPLGTMANVFMKGKGEVVLTRFQTTERH